MNKRLSYVLLSILVLFSIPIVGMQIEEKNPVYEAVCTANVAELAGLLLSAPHSIRYLNKPVKDGQTALHHAVITQQEEMVKLLLRQGAQCNQKDFLLRTPLHHAVISGNVTIVKLLLAYGASTRYRDCATRTPLYYAETFKRPDLVSILSSS